jgi:hypothetical protein
VLPEIGFVTLFRGNDLVNGVQDRSGAVERLDRINGPVARVCEGAVFVPSTLELPELPGTDRCRRCCQFLDVPLLVLCFSHTELTVLTSNRDGVKGISERLCGTEDGCNPLLDADEAPFQEGHLQSD